MQYSNQYVDKIVDYTYSTKKKIDMLLELDATQYCNLGIDSTKQQKEEVYGEREEARKEVNGVQKREWEIEEKRESKRQLEEMRRAEFAKNIVTKDK